MKRQEKIDALKKALQYINQYWCEYELLGLCRVFYELKDKGKIKACVTIYWINVIDRLERNDWIYVWKRGMKVPRIKWLKEQIAKLENKKANS